MIAPTSLKSQWANEIARFCKRDCALVLAQLPERQTEIVRIEPTEE